MGESNAAAFNLTMTVNPGSDDPNDLSPGDNVIVDIYLDADPGLGLLGVALLFDGNGGDGDLRYAGRDAEVTVYLERRMRIPEIWVQPAAGVVLDLIMRVNIAQQIAQNRESPVPVAEPGPKTDTPCHSPPGALIAPGVE